MFDYDPQEKPESTGYAGLKIVAALVPVLILLLFLGKAEMGFTVVIVLGMILFAIKLRWRLRRRVWFWAAIIAVLALHVPLLFFVRWPESNVPAILYSFPLGIVDFLIVLGAVGLAEKLFSKGSSLNGGGED